MDLKLTFGAIDYVAHMLYCYRSQDNGETGARWWAMTSGQRRPWREKALKQIREWRAVERGTQISNQPEVSFRPAFSAGEKHGS